MPFFFVCALPIVSHRLVSCYKEVNAVRAFVPTVIIPGIRASDLTYLINSFHIVATDNLIIIVRCSVKAL